MLVQLTDVTHYTLSWFPMVLWTSGGIKKVIFQPSELGVKTSYKLVEKTSYKLDHENPLQNLPLARDFLHCCPPACMENKTPLYLDFLFTKFLTKLGENSRWEKQNSRLI